MAGDAETLTSTQYIQHHLQNLKIQVGEGGFVNWHCALDHALLDAGKVFAVLVTGFHERIAQVVLHQFARDARDPLVAAQAVIEGGGCCGVHGGLLKGG